MSELYRSSPLKDIEFVREIYGGIPDEAIPFLSEVDRAKNFLRNLTSGNELSDYGAVVSVEGSWGSGKTTFVNLILDELKDSNVAIIEFDSMYYGNSSEAAEVFFNKIFSSIKESFGVSIKSKNGIIKNISHRFELSNGMPKLTFDYSPKTESSEEIMEYGLKSKLKNIHGKVLIVIDDLDRVSSVDVVHFLRIVRVLREIPNIIVIIPIDMNALQFLLAKERVVNPKAYLQKIIDKSFFLDNDETTSNILFSQLLYISHPKFIEYPEVIDALWYMYLWEISLKQAKIAERNGTRFTMGAALGSSEWSQMEAVSSDDGDNFVREFFTRTSNPYGANNNFVYRVENRLDYDQYEHYSSLYANTYFTDFVQGRSYPDKRLARINTGGIYNAKWWNDKDSIFQKEFGNPSGHYSIYIDDKTENQKQKHYEEMDKMASRVWDAIASVPSNRLPSAARVNLSPRIIIRVVNNLDLDQVSTNLTADEYIPILGTLMSEAVKRSIDIEH